MCIMTAFCFQNIWPARVLLKMLSQVCFALEPMLRLSSIRRGDLFIIQIIQASKGTFPQIISVCMKAYDDMIYSKEEQQWRHNPLSPMRNCLHRFCSLLECGIVYSHKGQSSVYRMSQVLLLINIEAFIEHVLCAKF